MFQLILALLNYRHAKKIVQFNLKQAWDISRQSLAYGWEIGKGAEMEEIISVSPDNPFRSLPTRDSNG